MKVCPKCGSQMNDTDLFCQNCGMSFGGGAPHENPQQPNGGQQNNWQQPVGVIIALLGSQSSPYAGFHVRQSLKFTVVDILLGIIGAVLFWTFLIPVACGICYAVLFVVRIICFFSICKGQAKEPPIIRSLGFLR